MKNVLFIHSSAELYGSDRSLLYLVSNLDKTRFGVHVLLPVDGPLVTEMKKLDGVTVNIFEVAVLRRKNLSVKGMRQYVNYFRISWRYIKDYIQFHNIDIVYTNTAVVFPGGMAAKHMHKKSIWHIREIIKSNLENRVVSCIIKRFSDVIIANSGATGRAISSNAEKVHVVYNAVEDKTDRSMPVKAEGQEWVVGMAGRINRWKGQKLFVDAAELILKQVPNVRFEIAGAAYEGEEYLAEDLKHYIVEKGLTDKICLLGQVTDMDGFYSNLDVFVLPSIQPEPFGLVVLEAMEWAVPVVATNHGGPAEILQDGVNGYLVSYEDATEMSERIVNLLQDEDCRMRIGSQGKKRKRDAFSLEKTVSSIEEILEHLL